MRAVVPSATLRWESWDAFADSADADVDVLLVTAGDADDQLVERFSETLPRARVHGMPDAGHDLLGEAAPDLVPVVGPFLASGTRGP